MILAFALSTSNLQLQEGEHCIFWLYWELQTLEGGMFCQAIRVFLFNI